MRPRESVVAEAETGVSRSMRDGSERLSACRFAVAWELFRGQWGQWGQYGENSFMYGYGVRHWGELSVVRWEKGLEDEEEARRACSFIPPRVKDDGTG